jgi:hypothetical protein
MMAGYFYAPPPSRIGGSQPYAPRLGLVQSGPNQAPPLRGPLAVATLAVLIAAWKPPFVQAQGSADFAPTLPVTASNPPPSLQQPHIIGSWYQDAVTVLHLSQLAATFISADPPPASSKVNSNTIRAAWTPPWVPVQGYGDSAPFLPAPAAPTPPPVVTRVNDRTIAQSWVPLWYGPPAPLSTSALPAAPIPNAPPVLTRVNERTVVRAWTPPWIAPPKPVSTSAFPAPAAPSAPPVRTYTVLNSIVAQWVSIQPTQRQATVTLMPIVVPPIAVATPRNRQIIVFNQRKIRV